MSEWQPIETAPTDGTEILTYARRFSVLIEAHFVSKQYLEEEYGDPDYMEEGWYPSVGYPDSWEEVICPTHWMPLPDPPEQDT